MWKLFVLAPYGNVEEELKTLMTSGVLKMTMSLKYILFKTNYFLSLQTFCQRTLREVKMLTRFEHENIIDLKDVICENTVDKLKVRLGGWRQMYQDA